VILVLDNFCVEFVVDTIARQGLLNNLRFFAI